MVHCEADYIKQCEEGDIYYRIIKDKMMQIKIIKITHHKLGHYSYKDNLNGTHFGNNFGRSLFKTAKECEDELYRRQCVKEKRQMLKEYETELNKKFDLKDHRIIK